MAVSAGSSPTGPRRTKSDCFTCWAGAVAALAATRPDALRFLGCDGFVTSKDVVACLRDAGLDVPEEVKSKGDLAKVQGQFNAWAKETGLPYIHLSRICAMSIGENHAAHPLAHLVGDAD